MFDGVRNRPGVEGCLQHGGPRGVFSGLRYNGCTVVGRVDEMVRDLPRGQRILFVALGLLGGMGCGLAAGGYMGLLFLVAPVVVLALTLVRPLTGVAILAAALPTYSLKIPDIEMSPFRAMGIVVFAGWILGALVRRDGLPRLRPMDLCAFLYLMAAMLSAVVNGEAADAIETDVQLVVLYVMVTGVARTPKAARVLLAAVLIGQVLNGSVAAYQRQTRNYGFLNPTVDLDAWGQRAPGLSDPNETGIKLAYTMPLAFTFMALSTTPLLVRGGLGIASCVMLFGLFGTASRGGVLTFVAAVVLWMIMWLLSASSLPAPQGLPNAPPSAAGNRMRHIAIAVLLGLVLGGFYMKVVRNRLSEDFERRWNKTMTVDTANPLDDQAFTGRVGIWRRALGMFAEKPFFGHGPRTGVKTDLEGPDDDTTAAHNTVLQVAVQEGLVGSIPFHLAFWLSLHSLWRRRRELLEAGLGLDRVYVSTLIVVILSIMFGAMGGTFAHDKDVWFLLGLASAMTAPGVLKGAEGAEARAESPFPARRLRGRVTA